MPAGSWQIHSLPGSFFPWADLAPFPAFPHFLNAQYPELGSLLSGHHLGLQRHGFSDQPKVAPAWGTIGGHNSGCPPPRDAV